MGKVLVITPTLERPGMCARALKSVLRQDFASWDAVIAKNGGEDHLDAYMSALRGPLALPNVRIEVLPEKGLGYALNRAAEWHLRDHDAFAVLEDDDEWDPAFLQVMYRELMRSGADVAHCLQRQVPYRRQSPGGPMNQGAICKRNWINFPMCLFRASLFERAGGFSEEAGPATDWDWHLRILAVKGKYQFVNETLATHHWHDHNYCIEVDGEPFIRRQLKEGTYG